MIAAPNLAYNLLARRLQQAEPGQFDLSSLRWAPWGAEQVDHADVEELCAAGARFGLKAEAIVLAYGMAETTGRSRLAPAAQALSLTRSMPTSWPCCAAPFPLHGQPAAGGV